MTDFEEFVWRNQDRATWWISEKTGKTAHEIWAAYDNALEEMKTYGIPKKQESPHRPWTDEEYQKLCEMKEAGATYDEISAALNRHVQSVLSKWKKTHGTNGHPHWTDEEIKLMNELRAQGLSQTKIAERLGRSKGAISGLITRLNKQKDDGTTKYGVPPRKENE